MPGRRSDTGCAASPEARAVSVEGPASEPDVAEASHAAVAGAIRPAVQDIAAEIASARRSSMAALAGRLRRAQPSLRAITQPYATRSRSYKRSTTPVNALLMDSLVLLLGEGR